MNTPLENIVEWFNALPVSYRQAVAVEVASMMPGMEPNISNPFYHKQFIAKISEPQPDRMKEEGLVVSLKALIEDIITVRTKENENWEQMEKELKEAAELTGSCSLAEHAYQKQIQYKQWTAIRESWKAMAAQSLTYQALCLWRKALQTA